MEIKLTRSLRGDGATLMSVSIPKDLETKNLASEERKKLAMVFMEAAYRLLANAPTH